MKSQKLLSYTRRAINDYDMISPGDKIAIGISGGKDSLTLLYAMSKLKKFYPIPFEIEAITVDLGFKDFDTSRLKEYCESLGVNYTVCKTHIGEIVFDYRKEPNPCSLCSRMRKGAFNDCAAELGCNKIAYAHHKDDVIDSFLMSMLYEGRIHTFSPVTHLEKSGVTLIRPLIYALEGEIRAFARANDFQSARTLVPLTASQNVRKAKTL